MCCEILFLMTAGFSPLSGEGGEGMESRCVWQRREKKAPAGRAARPCCHDERVRCRHPGHQGWGGRERQWST